MIYLKDFWIYGPDGKPICDHAAKEDRPKESDQKHYAVKRSWVYSATEIPPAPYYGRCTKAPTESTQGKIKRVAEIAALIAAVIGVPVLGFQSFQMAKATNAAVQQARAAQQQAGAEAGQLVAMGEQRVADERAWIGISKPLNTVLIRDDGVHTNAVRFIVTTKSVF